MSFKKGIVLLSVILVLGCCTPESESVLPTSTDTQLMAGHQEAEKWADEVLANLSLEKKIGQMICEQMRGEYAAEKDPQFQYLLKLVKEHGIGSFVLYGGTPHDTARLLNRLQKESELPLMITADFEGGPGQQIQGATEFPANMALSAVDSEEIAYEL